MTGDNPIYVTRPFLPPLEEFVPYMQEIWANKWLTNNGPFHQQLESQLSAFLGVEHLSLMSNATIGLIIALQALRVSGEVITTPYSFVATAHSLLWNNLEPVFVDIEPDTFNLDPERIEAAITPRTSAIMPVHCYGTPCNTKRIQQIADVHGLKVIYDAAHAFDVRFEGQSVLNTGDLSVMSFHATKVFNTFEGGAIVCSDAKLKQRVDYLRNFGFADEVTVMAPGINGKMTEIQSAFGLLQLKYAKAAIRSRLEIAETYRERLRGVKGVRVLTIPIGVEHNGAYFPILIEPDYPLTRDGLYNKLRENGIYSRRYFYPLISSMPMYRNLTSSLPANLPVANLIAERILCLPIYSDMEPREVDRVMAVVAGERRA